jgi:hypothetical protein
MEKANLDRIVLSSRNLGYAEAIGDVLSALAHETATWDHIWTPEGESREKLHPHTLITILQLVDSLRLQNDARGDAAREV